MYCKFYFIFFPSNSTYFLFDSVACLIEIPNRPPDYYAKAVKYCDVVLESEPNNLKALYRKSIGLYLAQNYHPALSLLRVVDKRLNGRG